MIKSCRYPGMHLQNNYVKMSNIVMMMMRMICTTIQITIAAETKIAPSCLKRKYHEQMSYVILRIKFVIHIENQVLHCRRGD